jgi:hypothetical protein
MPCSIILFIPMHGLSLKVYICVALRVGSEESLIAQADSDEIQVLN